MSNKRKLIGVENPGMGGRFKKVIRPL